MNIKGIKPSLLKSLIAKSIHLLVIFSYLTLTLAPNYALATQTITETETRPRRQTLHLRPFPAPPEQSVPHYKIRLTPNENAGHFTLTIRKKVGSEVIDFAPEPVTPEKRAFLIEGLGNLEIQPNGLATLSRAHLNTDLLSLSVRAPQGLTLNNFNFNRLKSRSLLTFDHYVTAQTTHLTGQDPEKLLLSIKQNATFKTKDLSLNHGKALILGTLSLQQSTLQGQDSSYWVAPSGSLAGSITAGRLNQVVNHGSVMLPNSILEVQGGNNKGTLVARALDIAGQFTNYNQLQAQTLLGQGNFINHAAFKELQYLNIRQFHNVSQDGSTPTLASDAPTSTTLTIGPEVERFVNGEGAQVTYSTLTLQQPLNQGTGPVFHNQGDIIIKDTLEAQGTTLINDGTMTIEYLALKDRAVLCNRLTGSLVLHPKAKKDDLITSILNNLRPGDIVNEGEIQSYGSIGSNGLSHFETNQGSWTHYGYLGKERGTPNEKNQYIFNGKVTLTNGLFSSRGYQPGLTFVNHGDLTFDILMHSFSGLKVINHKTFKFHEDNFTPLDIENYGHLSFNTCLYYIRRLVNSGRVIFAYSRSPYVVNGCGWFNNKQDVSFQGQERFVFQNTGTIEVQGDLHYALTTPLGRAEIAGNLSYPLLQTNARLLKNLAQVQTQAPLHLDLDTLEITEDLDLSGLAGLSITAKRALIKATLKVYGDTSIETTEEDLQLGTDLEHFGQIISHNGKINLKAHKGKVIGEFMKLFARQDVWVQGQRLQLGGLIKAPANRVKHLGTTASGSFGGGPHHYDTQIFDLNGSEIISGGKIMLESSEQPCDLRRLKTLPSTATTREAQQEHVKKLILAYMLNKKLIELGVVSHSSSPDIAGLFMRKFSQNYPIFTAFTAYAQNHLEEDLQTLGLPLIPILTSNQLSYTLLHKFTGFLGVRAIDDLIKEAEAQVASHQTPFIPLTLAGLQTYAKQGMELKTLGHANIRRCELQGEGNFLLNGQSFSIESAGQQQLFLHHEDCPNGCGYSPRRYGTVFLSEPTYVRFMGDIILNAQDGTLSASELHAGGLIHDNVLGKLKKVSLVDQRGTEYHECKHSGRRRSYAIGYSHNFVQPAVEQSSQGILIQSGELEAFMRMSAPIITLRTGQSRLYNDSWRRPTVEPTTYHINLNEFLQSRPQFQRMIQQANLFDDLSQVPAAEALPLIQSLNPNLPTPAMMQACLHPLTLQTAFGQAAGRLYLPQHLNVNLPRFILEQSLNLAHRVQMQQEADRRRLIEEAQEPTVYIDRNAVTLRIPRSVVNPYQSVGDMESVIHDNRNTGDNIYSGTRSIAPGGITIESTEGSCLQQTPINKWDDGTSERQFLGPTTQFEAAEAKVNTTAAQHIVEQGTYKKGGTGIHNVAGGDIINVPTVVHDTEHSKDTKRVSLINNPCVSESGGDITNDAEGHITLQSTQAKAVGDYRADAGTGVSMPAARDVEHVEVTSRSKGSLGGTKTRTEVHHRETNKVANINVGGKIKLGTKEGNITTEAPVLKAGQGISFSSPAGKLVLKAVRDTYFHSVQKSSSNLAWQSVVNEGESRSTVRQGVYDPGEGEITVDAPEVSVEKRAEDLHKLDALFKALKNHDKVTWQGLEDTYESWHEEHHSLSPALGVVIGIAVGMLTAGTGAGAAVATLVEAGKTAAAFISGAVNAGISSLASQASISMINNQGDIGAVLKELSSEKSLRSLVTTMATAGLTKVACLELKINLGSAENPQSFVDRTKENLVRAGVNIPLESMMNGQDFGQTLESNLRSGIANTLAGHAAAKIGVAYHSSDASGPQLDEVSHKLLHALVGAGMAAITKGDILAGSVGAVIGEIVAAKYRENLGEEYDPSKEDFDKLKERGVQLARLSAAFAAFLTGRDPNDAAMTAGNAARENAMQVTFEQHLEERQAKAPATEEEEEDPVTSKKDKGKEKVDDQDDAEAEGVEDEELGLKAALKNSRITHALEEEARQQQEEDEQQRIGILEDIFTPRTEAEWDIFRQARAELEENDPATSKRDKGKERVYDRDEGEAEPAPTTGSANGSIAGRIAEARYRQIDNLLGGITEGGQPAAGKATSEAADMLRFMAERHNRHQEDVLNNIADGQQPLNFIRNAAQWIRDTEQRVDAFRMNHPKAHFITEAALENIGGLLLLVATGGLSQVYENLGINERAGQYLGKKAEAVIKKYSKEIDQGLNYLSRTLDAPQEDILTITQAGFLLASLRAETKALGSTAKKLTPIVKLGAKRQKKDTLNQLRILRNRQGRVKGVTYVQNHHIISNKTSYLAEHPLWQKAGISPESPLNKMLLPTKKGALFSTTTRSIHQGRHRNSVHKRLLRQMEYQMRQGDKENWTQIQYFNALKSIIKKEAKALKSGDRVLNKHHRPGAKDRG